MKRLLTIIIILAAALGFGVYTSQSIKLQNDALQKKIESALTAPKTNPSDAKTIAESCFALTDGLGQILNDDKISTVSYQAHLLSFAADEQDEQRMRETLFLLSRSLDDLAEAESVSFRSIL